jgi:hypothetical protein
MTAEKFISLLSEFDQDKDLSINFDEKKSLIIIGDGCGPSLCIDISDEDVCNNSH